MQAPAWAPASVGSAYGRSPTDAASLLSGEDWERMLESLARVGSLLQSTRAPTEATDRAEGYRHLLVLLALGIDEALRSSDPYRPRFTPANVDNVLKWGMDCPDAAYSGAAIRGDATYIVRARRNSVRYLGFQAMGGMENTGNVVADDLEMDGEGRFELILSADEHPGNWMPLDSRSSSLVVRQFFYDWSEEVAADLSIECTSRPATARAPDVPAPVSAAGVGGQLRALGDFIEASVAFWLDVEEGGRSQGVNCFREPAALTGMGAAAENVSTWGSWSLADDEALLIEVTPPEALYWSVSLGNYWWESIDYAKRQSSLNGHQARLDSDGVFRAVVAHTDPGLANWLDTAGNHHGAMIFRWLRADTAPVPEVRVVPFDTLRDAVPPGAPLMAADERSQELAARRAAVERRFPREEVTMDLGIHDAKAVVTGGSKGMGRAIAERLAAEGADVAVLARGREALADTVTSLHEAGRGESVGLSVDVTDRSEVDAAFEELRGRWGSLNILINTLGPGAGRFEALEDRDWEETLQIGLMAAVRCVRAGLPLLRQAEWARIVNVSAHSIQRQSPLLVAYTAAKSALASVSKNLSKSLAPEGILVNTVSPGSIVTASFSEGLRGTFDAEGLDATDPHDVMVWIDRHFHQPADLGRAGLPEEVATLTAYLASRTNGYVTGANVNIDGGSDFV